MNTLLLIILSLVLLGVIIGVVVYFVNREGYKSKLVFIHIGKCGGTTVYFFLNKYFSNYERIHLEKPIYEQHKKYVIWVRNPLKRFVSAFWFAHTLINTDTDNLNINNLTIDNCLEPGIVKYKMTHKNTFTAKYDSLINFFKTPNNLAESLTSSNPLIKQKAIELMNYDIKNNNNKYRRGHIYQSISWYLKEFLNNCNKNNILLVGRMEYINQDIEKLKLLFNIPKQKQANFLRKNKNTNTDKYLSPLAIQNLIKFYKKDYDCLKQLEKMGFLDNIYIKKCYYYN